MRGEAVVPQSVDDAFLVGVGAVLAEFRFALNIGDGELDPQHPAQLPLDALLGRVGDMPGVGAAGLVEVGELAYRVSQPVVVVDADSACEALLAARLDRR